MDNLTFDRAASVGQIAAEHPETVSVFLQRGIDFCCGGKHSLEQACAEAGVDETELLVQLSETVTSNGISRGNWTARPLTDLTDFIVASYHAPLRGQLPTLEILAKRVESAHGPEQGPVLSTLRETVQELCADLRNHMLDEEQRLFPMIREGHSDRIPETLEQLVQDHLAVAATLARIRELTGGYNLPEHACETWRAFWWNLQKLESDLKEHIHLENNVLFPRALEAA